MSIALARGLVGGRYWSYAVPHAPGSISYCEFSYGIVLQVGKKYWVVCDGLRGIENAIGRHYGMAKIPLCTGHIERTLQKYVKPKDKATLGQDWDEVFKTGDSRDDKQKAREAWKRFCAKWASIIRR